VKKYAESNKVRDFSTGMSSQNQIQYKKGWNSKNRFSVQGLNSP